MVKCAVSKQQNGESSDYFSAVFIFGLDDPASPEYYMGSGEKGELLCLETRVEH